MISLDCVFTCDGPFCIFQELDSQKKKALQIECEKGNNNDSLEYLRSLDSEMVLNGVEVSLIFILSLNILSCVYVTRNVFTGYWVISALFFEDQTTSSAFMHDYVIRSTEGGDGTGRKVETSRDYLA